MSDRSIGELVALEDRNEEVDHLLALINDSRAQLRRIIAARERQLRMIARLSATGGWTLHLHPLRLVTSVEWRRLHGFRTEDEPSLLRVLRLVVRRDRKPLLAAIRRCAATGERADLVICSRHVAGHRIYMRMVGEAIHDESRRIVAMEGACQDVTPHVKREQELAAHRDSLEELVEQRTRDLQTFSHALAHDLRTPIAAMAGFAQVLAERSDEKLDAKARHRLDRIVANAHRAEALIDGILGMVSHLQDALDKRPVDMTALARDALDQLQSSERSAHVKVHIQEGMTAFGDPRLLLSVMSNLIGNACKFSSRRPDARVDVGQTADGTFHVKDNGVGFSMEHASRLFQPLWRLHDEREFEGLGIGLATAYRIVQRHGGSMWAQAAPGEGATFRFTLPDWTEIG